MIDVMQLPGSIYFATLQGYQCGDEAVYENGPMKCTFVDLKLELYFIQLIIAVVDSVIILT